MLRYTDKPGVAKNRIGRKGQESSQEAKNKDCALLQKQPACLGGGTLFDYQVSVNVHFISV